MYKLVAIVMTLALCACSTLLPTPPKIITCQNAAQWFANDDKGATTTAVVVCFAADGSLRWKARPVTLDELHKIAPAPALAPGAPQNNSVHSLGKIKK